MDSFDENLDYTLTNLSEIDEETGDRVISSGNIAIALLEYYTEKLRRIIG